MLGRSTSDPRVHSIESPIAPRAEFWRFPRNPNRGMPRADPLRARSRTPASARGGRLPQVTYLHEAALCLQLALETPKRWIHSPEDPLTPPFVGSDDRAATAAGCAG